MKLKVVVFALFLIALACRQKKQSTIDTPEELYNEQLIAHLDTIWRTEQEPLEISHALRSKIKKHLLYLKNFALSCNVPGKYRSVHWAV